ncbi:RNA-directed DNA polymerase, eukaryota [Artemisia annua]|uniref:RNA-directed DNA polymerase, eukaryota n=1 Tax=Artemisia annua TaxID=35608 RepID=A0A2U1PNY6_ARTAN|nr:RNA-directed DNA polymerase, eukaryota [Artemisia annua]
MREKEEAWQEVQPRKNNIRRTHNGESNKEITKFYISNLPNGCIPGDVKRILGDFGDIVGTYIARKKDKEGNRFGFVSFRRVRNVFDLEKRLNGIKMGACRLKVNIAKFAAENNGMWEKEARPNRSFEKKEEVQNKQQAKSAKVFHPAGGLSFREALDGKKKSNEHFVAGHHVKSLVVPENTSAFPEVFGKTLVGRVVDVKSLVAMDRVLGDIGLAGVEIIYIGGLSLLLKFVNHDEAADFLLRVDVWSRWFSVLDTWEGQSLPFERIAWLKILGVPLNLAVNGVYDNIAGLFGKVVHAAQASLDDGNISVVRVGVLVGEGDVVSDYVNLRWRDKSFKVWVIEDPRDWDPECSGVDILEEGELREEVELNNCGEQNEVGDSQQPHACMDSLSKNDVVEGNNSFCFKLLGIDSVPSTQEEPIEQGNNRIDGAAIFEDLDLNVRAYEECGGTGFVSRSNQTLDQVVEGEVGVDNLVAKEVEATVDVGEAVGVLLADHLELVKEAMVSEGIGGLVKGPWVGNIRKKEGINFVALQESKLSRVCEADLRPFWGGSRFEMDFVGSLGSAGGVVSMWDPLVFEAVESLKDTNFLLVRGKLKGSGDSLNVMNVYAPQSSSAKTLLWSKIEDVANRYQGMWLIAGDFNVVRSPEERRNSVFKAGCARVFNEFIHNMGLKEFSLKGRQFTCIRDNGRKLSKLDRMLVCPDLFDKWPEACLRVISGPHSDHSPLILVMKTVDFGPRPFRTFNSWFSKPGFEEAVREAVVSFSGCGCPDKVLTQKFAYIRDRLKRWRDDMIKKEGEEEAAALAELEELECALESRDLEEEEVWTMGECKKEQVH